jgi:SIR2-like domain
VRVTSSAVRKTTYVLGAGASYHAGFPLCSELWPKMAMWVVDSQPVDSEYRRAIDTMIALHGLVVDVEDMFTNLDLGRGVFQALNEDRRNGLRGTIARGLRDYFKSVCGQHIEASLYKAFASRVAGGDQIVTFNYDVALENALIGARKFGVKNGYGFAADWDETDSEVKVLKLHGSINWIGALFRGVTQGFSAFSNSLGERPFVDNVESLFPGYPSRVLDRSFPGGGVAGGASTLVLPTYEKKYSVETSVGDEWGPFFESLWSQAAEAVEQSDRIVIIGYSMPDADHRSRALLLWGANKRAEVFLCCAGSNETLKRSFQTHEFWRVVEVGDFSDFLALN